jgi:large subunit ribosomal protein L20
MRVKSPRRQRHNKILKLAKGYRMTKHRLYKVAHEAVIHAGQYAFAGRRLRRRDLRRLWIIRINAALAQFGVSYSRFIAALNSKKIQLDRKILSELATNEPQAFAAVMKAAGFNTKTSK